MVGISDCHPGSYLSFNEKFLLALSGFLNKTEVLVLQELSFIKGSLLRSTMILRYRKMYLK